jgi:hypothetical protein
MKTKLTRQFSVFISLLAFLALMSGNAFAACVLLHETSPSGAVYNCVKNEDVVLSPYWQSDSGSYTFIAVSHTSLSGMASQIGVTVNALPSKISDLSVANQVEQFGAAATFTVTSGTTKRVFIVRSNHPTINPTSITDAAFITGTSNFAHGSVRIDQVSTHPEVSTRPTSLCSKETTANAISRCTGNVTGGYAGHGYTDATMMSYWGSVVVEKNTTGFAMEFLGDMNDTQGGYVIATGAVQANVTVSGPAAP